MHAVQVPQWSVAGVVDGQRQVRVDLAEKKIRAHFAREQQRVLAAPAETRLRGERHFEHRCAVGEDAISEVAYLVGDAVGEPLQARAQDLVIVATERVAGDVGAFAVVQDRIGWLPRPRASSSCVR